MLVSERSRIWSLPVWHDVSRGRRKDGYGEAFSRQEVIGAKRLGDTPTSSRTLLIVPALSATYTASLAAGSAMMARGLEERRMGEPSVFADLLALRRADLREVLLGKWRCQWRLRRGRWGSSPTHVLSLEKMTWIGGGSHWCWILGTGGQGHLDKAIDGG